MISKIQGYLRWREHCGNLGVSWTEGMCLDIVHSGEMGELYSKACVFQSLLPSQNLHVGIFFVLFSLVGLNEGDMRVTLRMTGTLILETSNLTQGTKKPRPAGPSSHRHKSLKTNSMSVHTPPSPPLAEIPSVRVY